MSYPASMQYPQFPNGGSQLPEKPPVPPKVQRVFQLTLVGAVLSLLGLLGLIGTSRITRTYLEQHNTRGLTAAQINTAVTVGIALDIVFVLVGVGLWLWMAFALRAGQNYARVVSSVFFGIYTVVALLSAAGAAVGGQARATVLSRVLTLLVWVVGLIATILMWNKENQTYFKRQVGYGVPGAAPGYPPAGYPQQPGYPPAGYPQAPSPYEAPTYPAVPQQQDSSQQANPPQQQ